MEQDPNTFSSPMPSSQSEECNISQVGSHSLSSGPGATVGDTATPFFVVRIPAWVHGEFQTDHKISKLTQGHMGTQKSREVEVPVPLAYLTRSSE